jgi:peptidyl-prolyl cis-trans isomerase C
MTAAARPLDGMTLGDLLGGARREAGTFAQWLTQADPALAARIASQSAPDEDLAGFARCAVANFGIDAEDADWSHLISAARDAEDPAIAVLGVIVRWQLAQPLRL